MFDLLDNFFFVFGLKLIVFNCFFDAFDEIMIYE